MQQHIFPAFTLSADATGITHVTDLRDPKRPIIAVDPLLTGLDAEGLALLRRADHTARLDGSALFLCAACDEPVHIRVLSVAEAGITDGRRAYFVHDPRDEARTCPCSDLHGTGLSAKQVDGARFSGRQEGRRHAHLKVQLCQMLLEHPLVADAACEVLVRGADEAGKPAWRKPDVMAWLLDGRQIAFDLQIARPLLTTVEGREAFYARENIGWHWIVDAQQPERLSYQGFQDFVLPQGGLVLGFQDTQMRGKIIEKAAHFSLLKMAENAQQTKFLTHRRQIDLETVMALAGYPAGGPPHFATDLRSIGLIRALRRPDRRNAEAMFNMISRSCGTPNWRQAEADCLPEVLRLMADILSGSRPFHPQIDIDQAVQRFTDLFGPTDAEFIPVMLWSTPVALALRTRPKLLRALRNTAVRPSLNAAMARSGQHPEALFALLTRWRPLLDRLFPGLSIGPIPARA